MTDLIQIWKRKRDITDKELLQTFKTTGDLVKETHATTKIQYKLEYD